MAVIESVPLVVEGISTICCIVPKINASAVIYDARKLVNRSRRGRLFCFSHKLRQIEFIWEAYSAIDFVLSPFSISKSLELEYKDLRHSKKPKLDFGLSQF